MKALAAAFLLLLCMLAAPLARGHTNAAAAAATNIVSQTPIGGQAFQVRAGVAPAGTLFWIDGWSFTPLVNQTKNGGVVSILALKNASTTTGNNINAVWYIRNPDDATRWTAKAWSGATEWEVIKTVKDSYSIPDCLDGDWATFTPKEIYLNATQPKNYSKGFMVDDPILATVEQAPNRDDIVEAFTSFGYKVADVPIDNKSLFFDSEDRTDKMLGALAAGVEAQASNPNPDEQVFSGTFQAKIQAIFGWWPCYPYSFTIPMKWSPWTAGPWVLVPCSVNMGGPAICCYEMKICRTRTIVEYTVTPSCAVGVSNTWVEQECFTHTGWLPTTTGGPCPAAPSSPLAPPPASPPSGVCPDRNILP